MPVVAVRVSLVAVQLGLGLTALGLWLVPDREFAPTTWAVVLILGAVACAWFTIRPDSRPAFVVSGFSVPILLIGRAIAAPFSIAAQAHPGYIYIEVGTWVTGAVLAAVVWLYLFRPFQEILEDRPT